MQENIRKLVSKIESKNYQVTEAVKIKTQIFNLNDYKSKQTTFSIFIKLKSKHFSHKKRLDFSITHSELSSSIFSLSQNISKEIISYNNKVSLEILESEISKESTFQNIPTVKEGL